MKKKPKQYKQFATKMATKLAHLISHTGLPEAALIACFITSRYLNNADFSYPSEIILPIIIFSVLALAVFWGYLLVLRSRFGARVAALCLIYVLYSFNYMSAWLRHIGKILLPNSLETYFGIATTTVVILAIGCGLLGFGLNWLARHVAIIRHLQPHKIIVFVLLFISLIQLYKVTSRIMSIRHELTYNYPAPNYTKTAGATVTKPDIYYFVFDRYGNKPTLQNNYNYDNSDIYSWLGAQGFVSREDGRANYPFTMESIASTLAMQYHTDLGKLFAGDEFQTAFPYRSVFNNPPIAQVLKQNGYQYSQVSSWWDFTRVGIKADTSPTISFRLRILGHNFYLSDLARDIVNKSILSQWLKKGVSFGNRSLIKYDQDNNPRQNFFAQEDAVKQLASSGHSQPQFTFAHFLAPHDPYIFDANGSDPNYNGGRNDDGLDETEKYTREISYLNTQIKDMMGYIRQHSPNAAIIIQSDEGPYPKQFRFELTPGHYYDPADLPLAQEQQKFGIFASYYMPGVEPSVVTDQITASVNPFRFILKNYLGYNLEMLPDCQFSTGDKFQIYGYTNQTAKLSATADKACDSL